MSKKFLFIFILLILNIYFYSQSIEEQKVKFNKSKEFLQEGEEFLKSNDFNKAELSFRKGLSLLENEKSNEINKLKFQLNTKLGEALYKEGREWEAKIPFLNALSISKELKDKKLESTALINLARCFFLQTQYDISLKNSYQALMIAEENGFLELASVAAYFCGMTNRNLEQFNDALKFFEKAIDYSKKTKNNIRLINSLNEKGNVLHLLGRDLEALKVKEEAIEIAKKENDLYTLSCCFNDIAVIYEAKGNHKLASSYYEESYKISKKIGYPRNIVITATNLAREEMI